MDAFSYIKKILICEVNPKMDTLQKKTQRQESVKVPVFYSC